MRGRLAVTFTTLGLLGGCAAVGEALGATCISLAASTAGELCFRLGVAVLCDDDDGDVVVDEDEGEGELEAPAEIGPSLSAPAADVPPCRVSQLDGGVWRLSCVDGSTAEALVAPRQTTGGGGDDDGAVEIDDLDDVFAVAGKRALRGPLSVRGNAILRLELPSLHSVQGDLNIERTTQLTALRFPNLAVVDGAVTISHNRRLVGDPLPRLREAQRVDVAFNDTLEGPVVDRLLGLYRR